MFNIAILGCGVVGSGVADILFTFWLRIAQELSNGGQGYILAICYTKKCQTTA